MAQARVWPTVAQKWSVLIVGCGLIGGSCALAIRRRWKHVRVLAIDRGRTRQVAIRDHVADECVTLRSLPRLIERERPSVIVLALALDGIVSVLEAVARACERLPVSKRPLVVDVGSVKGVVVEAAQRAQCPRFVPGHPLAGLERGTLAAATATLFDGAHFVLCPSPTADARDLELCGRFVAGLGATPVIVDAALHDQCLALTSHLPHLSALALMAAATSMERDLPRSRTHQLPWQLAAGSWRDATRVAIADAAVWRPILRHNRVAVIEALDRYLEALERARAGLVRGGEGVLDGGPAGLDAGSLGRKRRQIGAFLPPAASARPTPDGAGLRDGGRMPHDSQARRLSGRGRKRPRKRP